MTLARSHLERVELLADGVEKCRLRPPRGEPLELFMAGFDAASFHPGQFAAHGIDLPERIAQSVPKRQAEYFHGRILVRTALLALGLPSQDIASGAHREPLWPDGLIGSITHTQSRAAVIVMPAGRLRAIGMDIETVSPLLAASPLREEVFSADEVAQLDAVATNGLREALYTVGFSAKESFFKAAFGQVGRYFGFDALGVTRIDLDEGAIEFMVLQELSTELTPGARVQVRFTRIDESTVLTVCEL
ncbi:4'-phosphopantetheinyl transferase family protein [Lysobacter fragariae]